MIETITPVIGAEIGECVYKRTKDGFTVSIYVFKSGKYKANYKYVYHDGTCSSGSRMVSTYAQAAEYLNREIKWHLWHTEKEKYLEKCEEEFDKMEIVVDPPFVVEEE